MTQSTNQKEQNITNTTESGFVSLNMYTVLMAEQYKPKESEMTDYIKKVSKKHNAIKLDDIKITCKNSEYTIRIHKNEFKINFDFNSIEKDIKKWTVLQAGIKQFLRNKVIELAYSYLRIQLKNLTAVPKGVTKKSKRMADAERLTKYDYNNEGTLFDYIRERGQVDEIKELLNKKEFLHLKRSYVFIADALLNYIKLFRYATAYPKKHAEKNIRNGKKIVDLAQFSSKTSNDTYEEKIRIHDDWQSFCKMAGISNREQKHAIAKDLKNNGTIPAKTKAKVKGHDYILYQSDFLSYQLLTEPIRNSNLKNVTETIKEIKLFIDPSFLKSILTINAKEHGGYIYIPSPLQAILENVFQDTDKHKNLKDFCLKNGFKRTKGDKWSMGYRYLYEEIHAEVCLIKENFTYNGQSCHLIVLDNAKIKEYALKVSPSSFKGNKFSRKEAIERILTGLEVIRLATGDEEKDYINVLKIEYLDPAIHIIIKRMSLKKSQELEQLLLH